MNDLKQSFTNYRVRIMVKDRMGMLMERVCTKDFQDIIRCRIG